MSSFHFNKEQTTLDNKQQTRHIIKQPDSSIKNMHNKHVTCRPTLQRRQITHATGVGELNDAAALDCNVAAAAAAAAAANSDAAAAAVAVLANQQRYGQRIQPSLQSGSEGGQ